MKRNHKALGTEPHRGLIVGGLSHVASAALTLALVLALVLFGSLLARAQTFNYSVIHSFTGGTDGRWPEVGLIGDGSGSFYGSTSSGGRYGYGTIFLMSTSLKGRILYSFAGGTDGYLPSGGVMDGGVGYGTTISGGVYLSGTVYKLDSTGEKTILYSFTGGADGNVPSGLIHDANGNLYGTTIYGGNKLGWPCVGQGCGVVFELTPNQDGTWTGSVLYTFSGPDGSNPNAGLIRDAAGNLYGTTWYGGNLGLCYSEGCGVVFELTPSQDGTWTESVLYSFTGGSDGAYPGAGVIRDGKGNLYGTTNDFLAGGCASNCGTLFRLEPAGKLTTLHTFLGAPDGMFPNSSLVWDQAGNLYGTTTNGGNGFLPVGTVFMLDRTGKESVLYNFCSLNDCSDGKFPEGVVLDKTGNLYGAAEQGGATVKGSGCTYGCGVVFKLTRN